MGKHGPCNHCYVTSTPLWRNGPPEKPVLCNACGSRWRTKGTLTNYTPLHSRAEHEEFDDHGFSKVRAMSIKKKEGNFLKRHHENLDIGKFVIKLNRVHHLPPTKSQDEADSCSAISSTELTCPTQLETNTNVPSRKRTCFNRPKSSSIEKLTKDLYTILNEQRQSSHLFGSFEEDLIFANDSLPIGYGSVLISHPNPSSFASSIKEDESETSSLSMENHQPNIETYNKMKGPKEGISMKKVVENDESCCFSPRMVFNSCSPENSLLMFDSSTQFVQDQNCDYDLLLDLPSNNSFPEAELLI